MVQYAVKQVAMLAGVSVRTLHLYDQIGLLKPSARSKAGYRVYGEAELLRLQQILFYKEMEIPLQQIGAILDDPGFNLIEALSKHKASLKAKRKQLLTMLATVDKTIDHLKNKLMLNHEELYEGFSKEEAATMRREAVDAWGEQQLEKSESALLKMGKPNFKALKAEQQDIIAALLLLMNHDPESPEVQFEIARHYQNIRHFWGTQNEADPQAAAYVGLGQLYVTDERFTKVNGRPNAAFALFMSKAMKYYADKNLAG